MRDHKPKSLGKESRNLFLPLWGFGGSARATWRQKTKFLMYDLMDISEKKIVELIKALWAKNPIATIVIGLLEAVAVAIALWLFASCTSNLFVQKGNTGSNISSSTSPSVTSSIDSTKVIVPTK